MHLKMRSSSKYGRNMPPKWFYILLILVTITSGIFYKYCINYNPDHVPKSKGVLGEKENISFDIWLKNSSAYSYFEKYTIKTEGCHIPGMLPLDETIKKYVRYPNEIKPCPNTNYSVLARNTTHIWLNNNARILGHNNISLRNKTIRCCYSSFYRPDKITNIFSRNIEERIEFNDCVYFKDVIRVKDEFVKVSCNYSNRVIYEYVFDFVPFKNLWLHNDGVKENNNSAVKAKYNVLVIGIDGVSRLNFHRTMPKTAAFIKGQGAVELFGYNKVGYNSYTNIVPLLMGSTAEEIKNICHPVKWTTYDDCPFLWHRYKEAGFYTAFGEDASYGGTFNNLGRGHRKTPTDYYLHPFIDQAERVHICINHLYQMLLDYIKAITVTLWKKKLFGFFWETRVTHDYLNYPMLMDDSYLKIFSELKMSNYFDKTIVFLISDHGLRWGDFRKTKQGYLEERLPLAFVLTPSSFRKQFSEAFHNLQYNSRQLTTPFDLHETWLDLIDLENVKNEAIVERTRKLNSKIRGISLFVKIPETRTCEAAGIDVQWCTCDGVRVSVSNSSMEIMNASKYLIKNLNSLLSGYPQCKLLELGEIKESYRFDGTLEKDQRANWTVYSIVVKVKPSGGVFEAVLRDNGTWSVIGSVNQLDLYGHHSWCVNPVWVKEYCFCK